MNTEREKLVSVNSLNEVQWLVSNGIDFNKLERFTLVIEDVREKHWRVDTKQ